MRELEQRILFVPPTPRDGEITRSMLARVQLTCALCADLPELSKEIPRGAAAVLLTEEALDSAGIQNVLQTLDEQEPWSGLPVIMLLRGGAQSAAASRALHALRNVTLLERPAATRTVISAVEAAFRARQRQYQIREQIESIRKAEAIARELKAQLEIALEGERSARAEAEHANRMKDDFLSTLSHELRTPLNAIFGWTQILKESRGNLELLAEGIKVIDRNVRLQTQLIEDLLDISRIISGKVRLDIQEVDLPPVVMAAIDSVLPAAAAKGIHLEQVIDPLAGSVSGDPGRLQQVLWNLLTNAIKFTPKDGTVHVLVERVNSHVEIGIADTGEGIDAEFLPHLFERFSQADGSAKRRHGGLGIGLAVVKNLVELHGGSVSATSPGVGKGSTFTVHIPVRVARGIQDEQPRPASKRRPDVISGPGKLGGIKVLIVDDESDARDLVQRILTGCAAETTVAASAGDAVLLLKTFEPDVILSDIGMPGQDGYEFMQLVRSRGLKIPAIALTAFARPQDRIRVIEAGYQAHLPKPVEPAELVAMIASLAGHYGAAGV
jgi:signal transduction histidine kinase